jgi:hypothetical protein
MLIIPMYPQYRLYHVVPMNLMYHYFQKFLMCLHYQLYP